MKKLIIAVLMATVAATAMADGGRGRYYGGGGYHGEHHGGGYGPWGWAAPLIIGGAVGYWMNQPREVYVAPPPPVYIERAPATNCVRYITQDQYGNVLKEETRCNIQ